MIEPHSIDPERLAALLDGRLGVSEAAEVRAQLALGDDDILSGYADAVAIHAELRVHPIRRHLRWTLPVVALAAAAVASVWLASSRGSDYAPFVLASAISPTAALESPAWSVTRGADVNLSAQTRATRLGIALTDFEFAALRGKPGTEEARAVVTLLDAIPGGGPIAQPIRAFVAGSPLPTAEQRADVGQKALQLVDKTFADAGAYLGAARLALSASDGAFFDRRSTAALDAVGRNAGVNADVRALVERITTTTSAQPRDLIALGKAIDELVRLLAQ